MPRCSFSWNKLKELKEKNVIIGEPRLRNVNDTILAREVTLEKTPDGKESLKITVKASILNGQASSSQDSSRPPSQVQPVRPVYPTGLSRDRSKFILCTKNTASKEGRTGANTS